MIHRALVIRDDKGKFNDLEDVVRVARAQGQQVFKTKQNVKVIRIWGPDPEVGYVVVVEGPRCSDELGVSSRKTEQR